MTRILFVCLGNICRSPMAEYLMRDLVAKQGMTARFEIASAGTSGWHNGETLHAGTAAILNRLGIRHDDFVSSQVQSGDFAAYDYLIAMDGDNLQQLQNRFGVHSDKMFVVTDLIPEAGLDGIPDPWYTDNFTETRDLLTIACKVLLDQLTNCALHHAQPRNIG